MRELTAQLEASAAWAAAAASESPPRAQELPAEWSELPGGVIDGGEIVLMAIKPSMWRPLFDSAPWLITAGLFAVGILMMRTPLPGMSVSISAQVVLAIGFVRVAFAIVRWIATWYVLTNRRIMDIRGARAPRITSFALVEIRNTYMTATASEKLVGIGTITFVSKQADDHPYFWESVSKPDEVHAKIRRAIENALDQYGL